MACAWHRQAGILSAYGAKEEQFAEVVLSQGYVLGQRDTRIHKREAALDMVSGADIVYSVRNQDAVIQDDISLDISRIFGKRKRKSAETKRQKHERKSNARKTSE